MNCCGSKRKAWNIPASTDLPSAAPALPAYVRFRYVGKLSMTVTGGLTGQVYRFTGPGAEVLVDYRDAPGMLAVPNVERG